MLYVLGVVNISSSGFILQSFWKLKSLIKTLEICFLGKCPWLSHFQKAISTSEAEEQIDLLMYHENLCENIMRINTGK